MSSLFKSEGVSYHTRTETAVALDRTQSLLTYNNAILRYD
jgi:hypothetical protein